MRKNRFLWILFAVLALAYITLGLSRISFNVDILRLLPSHLHQVEGLSLFLKNFALPNELIVTVEAPDAEMAKSSAEAIAATLRASSPLVKSALAEPPWENHPEGFSEFLTFLLLNQSHDKMGEILQRLAPSQAAATLTNTLDELATSVSPQDIALHSYDPYGLSSSLSGIGVFGGAQQSEFSSADGKFRVIYVEASKSFANYNEMATWLKQIQGICQASHLGSEVKLGFTGEPAFVAEISTGMQRDMISSGLSTLLIISLIFWLCYGNFSPLRWLLFLLQLIFLFSLATAGLFFKQITVIGAGFASVMIGLSVDYGYFIYQQSLRQSVGVRQLQWKCLQNILWTSSTTAAAFFALNLSNLPGLSQLGNMVGIGVCIGAVVMLGIFAPVAVRLSRNRENKTASRLDPLFASPKFAAMGEWGAFAMVLLLLGGLIFKGGPDSDFSASTFRPRVSSSQNALEHLYSRLQDDRRLLSLVVEGKNEKDVLEKLQIIETRMAEAKIHGEVKSFLSPLALWPDENRQRENLARLGALSGELPRLQKTLLVNGFTDDAFALTHSVFAQVGTWQHRSLPLWPENESSRWILRRLARHTEGSFLALGMVEPTPGSESKLTEAFRDQGVYLVSWNTLGSELKRTMPREILLVSLGLMLGILLILAFGLRSLRALLLFTLTTALVLACLAGAMSLLGMKWGFFNLAAILLLLGTGTDYSILLLLALKRSGGDVPRARSELGLVIFLCSTSAAAGFGSLAWANNMGLATLGKTCALGLLIDGIISLFLLPRAWSYLKGKRKSEK